MEPTGGTPKLPDLQYLKIPEYIRPEAQMKHMTIDAIVTMFVSHMYYKYDGRPLAREETSSLMRTYWYTNSYTMNHDLLDKLENPNTALRIALRPLGKDRIEAVIPYVDHLFRDLLKENPEAEARARILSGFDRSLFKSSGQPKAFEHHESGPIAEKYRDFFEQKVVKEFEEYEKSKSEGSSSRSMLGLDPLSNVTEALENSTLQAPVELRLQFPEDQAQGPRRQELLERARREEMNKPEEGQRKERRRKRSKSPDSRQQYRPKPPPPPPPPSAAGQSHTPGSLPYDPARD